MINKLFYSFLLFNTVFIFRICLICLAESRLKVYESMLFSVSNKQKTLTDTTEETNEETMYESTSKGLWKMSQKEFLLMSQFYCIK